ncbi:MAG: outer membrane protein assembly factor BamB family protein [Planctomycetota bacterium]|jgi:outer membrane protein assembly factor BamB
MNSTTQKILALLLPLLLVVLAGVALFWWGKRDPTQHFTVSNPSPDPRLAAGGEVVEIGSRFMAFDHQATEMPGRWPGFRGVNRDNVVAATALADRWPEGGPKRLWSIRLGEGHAAPVVNQGRVYVLDYDEVKKSDMLRCFALADGTELWRRGWNHGFSRTVPAIADGKIVTIGPRNHVMCCDAFTGDLLWGIDLTEVYGTKVPFWYGGQCPYIDGDTVVLAVAGTEVLMVGVELATGRVRWSVPNETGIILSHSSIMPMTVGDTQMALYAGIGGFVGVGLTGPQTGQLLFRDESFKASVIAPSPLVLGEGRIFMTAGYGAGSATLRVVERGEAFAVEDVKVYATRDGLASEQQTPVLHENRIFAVLPKDGGGKRLQFVCVDPSDTTRILWASGKENRFGLGPYLVADGKVYLLNDDGVLVMIDAGADSYRELARAQVIEKGHDAWGPLVLVDGRMLLRDDKRMACIDLRIE